MFPPEAHPKNCPHFNKFRGSSTSNTVEISGGNAPRQLSGISSKTAKKLFRPLHAFVSHGQSKNVKNTKTGIETNTAIVKEIRFFTFNLSC